MRETRIKISKLTASVEAGIDPGALDPQVATRQAEKDRIERQIAAMNVEPGWACATRRRTTWVCAADSGAPE